LSGVLETTGYRSVTEQTEGGDWLSNKADEASDRLRCFCFLVLYD